MTDQQPNALRLADSLASDAVSPIDLKAAAELRRLHEENLELKSALGELLPAYKEASEALPLVHADRDAFALKAEKYAAANHRFAKVNAQLLEALVEASVALRIGHNSLAARIARAAIEAANSTCATALSDAPTGPAGCR